MKTQAQDYLISFAGTGETTEVGTVKVDNLTSGATLTLNGTDILHLTTEVGIGSLKNDIRTLQVYPNPMTEQSVLTFVVPENGNAVISIFDLSGKIVCQICSLLSTGTYSFLVSGIRQGIYFVKVIGENYSYSAKLISQNNLQGEPRVEYVFSSKNARSYPLKNSSSTIDMQYAEGDQLLYTGTSGIFSTIVTDIPTSSKTTTFNFVGCTDGDGNNYAIVQIGSGKSVQTWMAENLNYPTGNSWCYNDNTSNCDIYGRLYDWQAALGACPPGWHLPSDAEWTALIDFLGGVWIAGGKMKETGTAHWLSPNYGATNSSGFTARPGGWRDSGGFCNNFTVTAVFWSSTECYPGYAWYLYLLHDNECVIRYNNYDSTYGCSARCIKD